jgi:hypothetical protein
MTADREIMQLPLHLIDNPELTTPKRGHFARPGTGPSGETCGTCRHYVSKPYHMRTWRKCGRMEKAWTRGPGSDIRQRDPACSGWEAKAPKPA